MQQQHQTQEDTHYYERPASETSSELSASWNESQEKLLKAIAERSNCMRWLHTQCNLYFENLNFLFTIPNVVISTVNGSITMSLNTLFPGADQQKVATTVIGLISILSAVLITMNQYLKSQQMAEAHHAAGLSYSKLYRSIMNELALRRDQRTNGLEFLKHVRADIDRLEDTAPSVLPFIIKRFNRVFSLRDIEKPEITGDLDPVEINKDSKKRRAPSVTDVKEIYYEPGEERNSICDQSAAVLKGLFVRRSVAAASQQQLPNTPSSTSTDVKLNIIDGMQYLSEITDVSGAK